MIWKITLPENPVDHPTLFPLALQLFPMVSRIPSLPSRSSWAGPSLAPDRHVAGGSAAPWLRFSWKTAAIGPAPAGTDLIRPATREEGEEVLRVLLLALSMDAAWNDAYARAEQYLREGVSRLFNAEEPRCLVIPKGNRLIAASLIDPQPEAAVHLLSGPSVLMEYRNRGIGSRLLHASLVALGEAGVSEAHGFTRDKAVSAKHVYPKFGGVSEQAPLAFSQNP